MPSAYAGMNKENIIRAHTITENPLANFFIVLPSYIHFWSNKTTILILTLTIKRLLHSYIFEDSWFSYCPLSFFYPSFISFVLGHKPSMYFFLVRIVISFIFSSWVYQKFYFFQVLVRTTGLAGGLLSPYKGLFPACAWKAYWKVCLPHHFRSCPWRGWFSASWLRPSPTRGLLVCLWHNQKNDVLQRPHRPYHLNSSILLAVPKFTSRVRSLQWYRPPFAYHPSRQIHDGRADSPLRRRYSESGYP